MHNDYPVEGAIESPGASAGSTAGSARAVVLREGTERLHRRFRRPVPRGLGAFSVDGDFSVLPACCGAPFRVFLEAMRLLSPAWGGVREALVPDEFGGATIRPAARRVLAVRDASASGLLAGPRDVRSRSVPDEAGTRAHSSISVRDRGSTSRKWRGL